MDDISNRTLALLLIAAIFVSLVTTVGVLNRLGRFGEPTGLATTDSGNVTLTVANTVSIFLRNNTVNYGAGYVNTSCPATGVVNNATLYAGATYNDTDNYDCWTNYTASPTSLHLENDGNRNASVTVRGPHPVAFFSNTVARPVELMYRARNYESNSCDSGATLQTAYVNFTGAAGQALCTDLLFAAASDEIAIDFKVVIPSTISPGTYENASITFTAVQS